jgi:hypothetical protein
MPLTQYEKEANNIHWMRMMAFVAEGGNITWCNEGLTYTCKNGRMFAPNKKSFRKLCENTTKKFAEVHIRKAYK